MAKLVRGLGYLLIAAGTLVLLYVIYLLTFTTVHTERAQRDLATSFSTTAPATPDATPSAVEPETAEAVERGELYAVLRFERPGQDAPVVREGALYVVEGTGLEELKKGPGHYVGTGAPGQDGNVAVAGHRTTYGAPFYHLDELRPGDLIHVAGRDRVEYTYEVRTHEIVAPTDTWVIGEDPLGTGEPTLTLTTCHPRFSAAQRYIVFAALRPSGGGS